MLTKEQEKQLWLDRAAVTRVDPWYFLKYFTFTRDEHDPTTLAKPFPEKAVYRILTRVWQENSVIFIEKSRQVMMTWTMAGLFLWDAMFHKSRRGGDQSKKQEDADGILERQRHIYDNMKPFSALFDACGGFPQIKTTGAKTGTTSKLQFPNTKCEILAIPQGGDIVNSYTWSWLFADEINLQPQAAEGYSNALPALDRGGKWVGQGTANGKQFAYYVMNNIDPDTLKKKGKNRVDSNKAEKALVPPEELNEEQARRWIEKTVVAMSDEEFAAIPIEKLIASHPGMRYWVNCDGICCLRVHYTADPDKDPATEMGKEWYDTERPKYSQSQWERQFEINYETFEGRPVVPNWKRPIFVTNPQYDSNIPLRLSFDFGTEVCGCIFGHYARIDNFNARQIRLLDELILYGSNTPELVDAVIERLEAQYERSWRNGNIITYCDPAGHQSRETTSDSSQNTSIKILQANGIYPIAKKFGVRESTELIETVFALTLPNGQPFVQIADRCEYMIKCFQGGLHYPPENKGKPGHYEKDGVYDHGGDMFRYFVGNACDQFDLAQVKRKRPGQERFLRRRKYTGEVIGRVRRTSHNRRRGEHAAR